MRKCELPSFRRIPLVLAIAFGLTSPTAALAQFTGSTRSGSGTTTAGMFGSTTVGGTSSLNPQASRTGGTTGQAGMGTTGMGATGMGQMGAGQMGLGTQISLPLQQMGFVGASTANTGNLLSRQGTVGAPTTARLNFGGLQNLITLSRQNQFNQQQAQRGTRTSTQGQSAFRVPLRLGFQPPPVTVSRFNAPVSARLTKTPALGRLGPIEATLEGRTAVLRGTVASEADRQLAEGLVRLEPEVLAVRNELVVGSSAP